MDFTIKIGDTRSAMKCTLYNPSGSVVDLSYTTVKFILSDQVNKLMEIDGTVVDATKGIVWIQFGESDFTNLLSGVYSGEIRVTFNDNRVETYPNNGYIKVHVLKSL